MKETAAKKPSAKPQRASAKTESECELYRSRIEREQRLPYELQGVLPARFAA